MLLKPRYLKSTHSICSSHSTSELTHERNLVAQSHVYYTVGNYFDAFWVQS